MRGNNNNTNIVATRKYSGNSPSHQLLRSRSRTGKLQVSDALLSVLLVDSEIYRNAFDYWYDGGLSHFIGNIITQFLLYTRGGAFICDMGHG